MKIFGIRYYFAILKMLTFLQKIQNKKRGKPVVMFLYITFLAVEIELPMQMGWPNGVTLFAKSLLLDGD